MSNKVDDIRRWAALLHADRNQRYGVHSTYALHLDGVDAAIVRHFQSCWPGTRGPLQAALRIVGACHDLLEDTGLTYNDLRTELGSVLEFTELHQYLSLMVEAVYDLTNELGRNRAERHVRTLPKQKANKYARYVKLCDRLTNCLFSAMTGSSMYRKYAQEYPTFKSELYVQGEFTSLWAELDAVHGLIPLRATISALTVVEGGQAEGTH